MNGVRYEQSDERSEFEYTPSEATKKFHPRRLHRNCIARLARISHQGVDTWAKGMDEDIGKEDRLKLAAAVETLTGQIE